MKKVRTEFFMEKGEVGIKQWIPTNSGKGYTKWYTQTVFLNKRQIKRVSLMLNK